MDGPEVVLGIRTASGEGEDMIDLVRTGGATNVADPAVPLHNATVPFLPSPTPQRVWTALLDIAPGGTSVDLAVEGRAAGNGADLDLARSSHVPPQDGGRVPRP
jgi:hypothetical protein